MSKYHSECTKPTQENSRNKCAQGAQPELTLKPFCDCTYCMCKDCPDILKMYSITVTENSCHFGPKVGRNAKMNKTEPEQPNETVKEIENIVDNINQNRDCGCEVVARAVLSDTHAYMGLPEFRAAKKSQNTADSEKLTQQ